MRSGADGSNRMDQPVWPGPSERRALLPCPHEFNSSERVILIEPVIGLDMCCRCGAVFGPHRALATDEDFARILGEYVARETVEPTRYVPLWDRL